MKQESDGLFDIIAPPPPATLAETLTGSLLGHAGAWIGLLLALSLALWAYRERRRLRLHWRLHRLQATRRAAPAVEMAARLDQLLRQSHALPRLRADAAPSGLDPQTWESLVRLIEHLRYAPPSEEADRQLDEALGLARALTWQRPTEPPSR
ncbi:MAG: hypothetical protein PHI49_11445 [Halothiobacillaceae bacterium]|jgi:hypothetical protein|nr:hypothetical protein [Halothiobacillaceae bacterium]